MLLWVPICEFYLMLCPIGYVDDIAPYAVP